jgi:hypothetical protein
MIEFGNVLAKTLHEYPKPKNRAIDIEIDEAMTEQNIEGFGIDYLRENISDLSTNIRKKPETNTLSDFLDIWDR